jgi:glucose-1-phosphate cytidylyltransferase
MFLANYSDGLTDFYLPKLIDHVCTQKKVAGMLCVRPNQSYHIVLTKKDGVVEDIQGVNWADLWINGGYFVLSKDIFKYIKPGEDLVVEPFKRLIQEGKLTTQKYEGFWISMDTFKDKQRIDDMYYHGEAPWEIWKSERESNDKVCR